MEKKEKIGSEVLFDTVVVESEIPKHVASDILFITMVNNYNEFLDAMKLPIGKSPLGVNDCKNIYSKIEQRKNSTSTIIHSLNRLEKVSQFMKDFYEERFCKLALKE